MCTHLVLTSRASTIPRLQVAFSLRAFYTQPSGWFNLWVLMLRLIGESSSQRSIANLSGCSYATSDCCMLLWLQRER